LRVHLAAHSFGKPPAGANAVAEQELVNGVSRLLQSARTIGIAKAGMFIDRLNKIIVVKFLSWKKRVDYVPLWI
jgi:hypothetical protein